MSITKWFVFMKFSLALVLWTLGSGAAQAQDPKALSDGAALLQTLDKSNPAHNRLFQEVNKRLPESAKAGNSESPLLMNPPDEHRKFAADKGSDFIFIKKPDGTVGVANRSRVSKGLTSTVNHLTQHEDFPGLFRENYDRLKAEHNKALDKAKKKGGLAGLAARFASFPPRDAPASALRDYAKDAWGAAYSSVMRRIDEASNAVKEEELARIERGDPQPEPKPVQTAAEEEPEGEAETAKAEEPKDEPAEEQNADEAAAQRASATRKLDNKFNALDSSMAQFEAAANRDLAVCQRATDALKNGSEIDRLAKEVTYDRYHGYIKLDKDGNKAAFPFGFGLSYTTFEHKNAEVEISNDQINVAIEVQNTGYLEGDQVIQLYIGFNNSEIEREHKLLKDFKRIRLVPGETRQITLSCPLEKIKWYNPEKKEWELEKMQYEVYVGSSSNEDDLIKLSFQLD